MATRLALWLRHLALGLALGGTALLAGCDLFSGYDDEPAASCPEGLGWAEGLPNFFKADAQLPTTFGDDADDCLFHQWSWEAFSWATAEVDGKPRFMSLKTMDDLDPSPDGAPAPAGMLRLTPRSTKAHNLPVEDYDAAFVEADGSVLVGQNGYPVYASVHMNDAYFNTAKANLIENGGYKANVDTDKPGNAPADCGKIGLSEDAIKAYFPCGAAVFKATWMRLGPNETAPAGAFTTTAEVPRLRNLCTNDSCTVVATDQYEQVQVALVGLHVVGYVEHHPEFLWATFEHVNNSPAFPDGTFAFSDDSNPNAFTFYAAGTPFTQDRILVPNQPAKQGDPPLLTFDDATQTFSPITQVVQMNQTGGNTEPNGPANITAVNQASQQVMQNKSAWQANYFLVGTAWLEPDTYVATNPDIGNTGVQWNDKAKGSVALANMTAETFMQKPGKGDTLNCFACHNPQSFYFSDHTMALRRVAISHALAVDSPFAVPNIAQGKIPAARAPQN